MIVAEAQGKNGALFQFESQETGPAIDKGSSRVVERSWYQRNKHIYPASRA